MSLSEYLSQHWNNLIASGDVRTNELPLVQDPTFVIWVTLAYLVFVAVGPRLMKAQDAWEVRKPLICYNFLCVILSGWMMSEYVLCTLLNPNVDLIYEPIVETDTSANTVRLLNVHWWYFASKIIEFTDTAFFIVRKKNNQISFLHVYHHATMAVITWGMLKFVPGPTAYIGPLCNCFIHTVMYLYYLLSALGPHMQPYLWWKRYLTSMQLIQFVIVFAFCVYLILLGVYGPVLFFAWVKLIYMITLVMLFSNFYIQAYRSKAKKTD